MKKLFLISEEEKERILNMHQSASQKQYLKENKSNIFEEESLITEGNPILRFFKRLGTKKDGTKVKVDLNPRVLEKVKESFISQFEENIDGDDLLYLVRKRGEGDELLLFPQYELKKVRIDDDFIKNAIEGKYPEMNNLMKKTDYDKVDGYDGMIFTLENGKFKKGAKDFDKSTIKLTTKDFSDIMKKIKTSENWRKAKNIGLVIPIGGVSLFTLGLLYYWWDNISLGLIKLINAPFSAGKGLGEMIEKNFPGQVDPWVIEQCKKSTSVSMPGLDKNWINETLNKAKESNFIKIKMSNLSVDGIGVINSIWENMGNKNCFWQELLTKMGYKEFFNNVLTPININVKKEAQLADGILNGTNHLDLLDKSSDFPNKELNKSEIEKFKNNCPCVFLLGAGSNLKAFKLASNDPNNYKILFQDGEKIYSNVCHEYDFDLFDKRWKAFLDMASKDAEIKKMKKLTDIKKLSFSFEEHRDTRDKIEEEWKDTFNELYSPIGDDICPTILKKLG
jgi:hypothetical protein